MTTTDKTADASGAADLHQEAASLLSDLVDIWDDQETRPPESRVYVAGAWRATLAEARTLIAQIDALASEPAHPYIQKSDPTGTKSHENLADSPDVTLAGQLKPALSGVTDAMPDLPFADDFLSNPERHSDDWKAGWNAAKNRIEFLSLQFAAYRALPGALAAEVWERHAGEGPSRPASQWGPTDIARWPDAYREACRKEPTSVSGSPLVEKSHVCGVTCRRDDDNCNGYCKGDSAAPAKYFIIAATQSGVKDGV